MSQKIELDISSRATLELRYKDTASLALQIVNPAGVLQGLQTSTFSLDVHANDYAVITSIDAVIDDEGVSATFTISSAIWAHLNPRGKYNYRIRRAIGDEVKTIINGDINIK